MMQVQLKTKEYVPGTVILPKMMKYTLQVNEYESLQQKNNMTFLIGHYLAQNGRNINFTSSTAIETLVNLLIKDFGFLEFQEVEFILAKGVVGGYGNIYGEIYLDTVYPWFLKYIETERKERPEPQQKNIEVEKGGLSVQEFYERNPEYKKISQLKEIKDKAKRYQLKMVDIELIYELQNLTSVELKEDIEALKKDYENLSENEKEYYDFSIFVINYFTSQLNKK
jgi:hypothetical protein